MSRTRALPPIPVLEDCPVSLLLDYAEAVLDPAAIKTRWTVALEVYPAAGRKPAGISWFALVSLRPECRQLMTLINRALARERVIPYPRASLEIGTLKVLFQKMTAAGESVWFFPLFRQRGSVIFVRKPADDPNLKRLLRHNRTAQNPPLKLTKMSVVTRDQDASGSPALVRAALHFQVKDPKTLARLLRKK